VSAARSSSKRETPLIFEFPSSLPHLKHHSINFQVMSEESFYRPLTFPSHHSRFTLHYPRSSKDVKFFHESITNKETTKHLKGPFAPISDTTLEQAFEISEREAMDKTRVVFDIHQSTIK